MISALQFPIMHLSRLKEFCMQNRRLNNGIVVTFRRPTIQVDEKDTIRAYCIPSHRGTSTILHMNENAYVELLNNSSNFSCKNIILSI